MPEQPLTAKRLAFCREYVKDSNGAQAAIRAGYSVKTARTQAQQILTIPDIKQEIARLRAEQAEIGHRTVAGLDKLYADCYDAAQANKQPSAMVSAVTGIARLYNMDQPEGKADQPASITEEQAARWRVMADLATADNLNKPKLSKGA